MEKLITRVKILPDVCVPLVNKEALASFKKSTEKVDKVLAILKRAFDIKK